MSDLPFDPARHVPLFRGVQLERGGLVVAYHGSLDQYSPRPLVFITTALCPLALRGPRRRDLSQALVGE